MLSLNRPSIRLWLISPPSRPPCSSRSSSRGSGSGRHSSYSNILHQLAHRPIYPHWCICLFISIICWRTHPCDEHLSLCRLFVIPFGPVYIYCYFFFSFTHLSLYPSHFCAQASPWVWQKLSTLWTPRFFKTSTTWSSRYVRVALSWSLITLFQGASI